MSLEQIFFVMRPPPPPPPRYNFLPTAVHLYTGMCVWRFKFKPKNMGFTENFAPKNIGILKGGEVDCMEMVLCLSQKVAKNGQILSMFVPKKWLFSLLLQPHQGWLFKSKNWLMSKMCQPLSLVSGFFRSY